MQEPDKKTPPEGPQPLKGLNLNKFNDAADETIRSASKKGLSFFKTARAALKGDAGAKQQLTDNLSNAALKAHDALEQAGKVVDDTRQKIADELDRREGKNPPPPA